MAAKTSNGTGGGLWSATTTWSGGVVPVAGTDTVSIAAGDTVHADTASMTSGKLIVGSDPGTGGTAAITIGTSAQTTATNLIVDAGVVLWLRGDLTLTGQNASGGKFSTITLASSASLIFDPKSAAQYLMNFNNMAQAICNGATNTGVWPDTSSGNHCLVKTDTTRSGLNAYCVPSAANPSTACGGFTSCTFTDFVNIGTTSNFGISAYTYTPTFGAFPTTVSFTNCTFTGSNFEMMNDGNDTNWHGNFIFNDVLFSSSVICTQFGFNACCGFTLYTNPASETRQIQRCGFDGNVRFDGMNNCLVSGNVFAGNVAYPTWSSANLFTNNFINCSGTYQTYALHSMGSCYFYVSAAQTYIAYLNSGSVISNCIFDGSNAVGNPFFFFPSSGTVTIIGNIILQITSTTAAVGAPLAQAGWTATVEHNLLIGNASSGGTSPGGAAYGLAGVYSAGTAAGMVASCRSNILWAAAATTKLFAVSESFTSYTLDAVTVAGYNCYHNATSGEVKYNAGASNVTIPGYAFLEVTATGVPPANTQIGTGDFSADPQFADSGLRNMAQWGGTTDGGGTATFAAAKAVILANPSLLTKAATGLLMWVRAGYVPTNAALKNTTYPGDTATLDANGNSLDGTVGPMGFNSGQIAVHKDLSTRVPTNDNARARLIAWGE